MFDFSTVNAPYCLNQAKIEAVCRPKAIAAALAIILTLGALAAYAQIGQGLFSRFPIELGISYPLFTIASLFLCFYVSYKLSSNGDSSMILSNDGKIAQPVENSEIHESENGAAVKEEKRLPKLTDEQTAATTGESHWHSNWMRTSCFLYHQEGDTWADAQLKRFFSEGLLSHYLGEAAKRILGIQLDYNYEMWCEPHFKSRQYDTQLRSSFLKAFNLQDCKNEEPANMVKVLVEVMQQFKQLPVLLEMGADYQREKVRLEKISMQDAFIKETLALDLKLDKRQEAIYYMVEEFCDQFKKWWQIKRQSGDVPFNYQLPDFLNWPAYKPLIREKF